MTSVQSPSLTEVSSAIRVAIVCEPEATVLADSLEALLEQARGFTSSRFEYRAESDLKPRPIGIANPDVVVATPLPGTTIQLSNKGGIVTLLNREGLKVHGVQYTGEDVSEQGRTIVF
jgi:hypothetical protein